MDCYDTLAADREKVDNFESIVGKKSLIFPHLVDMPIIEVFCISVCLLRIVLLALV